MRLRRLVIHEWRDLRDVTFDVPAEATLVYLVGENGTGKSNLLELLSAVAFHVGLSPGVQTSRGNPLSERHSVEADVKLTEVPEQFMPGGLWKGFVQAGHKWDGTIRWQSRRDSNGHVTHASAGGAAAGQEQALRRASFSCGKQVARDCRKKFKNCESMWRTFDAKWKLPIGHH